MQTPRHFPPVEPVVGRPGIEHRLVSSPLHDGCIERGHRTLNERTLVDQSFAADRLQQQVDADWDELSAECPSRAKGCLGQPPLIRLK